MVMLSPDGQMSLLARCVTVRNRKKMQPALKRADRRLTIFATCDGSVAKWENRFAANM